MKNICDWNNCLENGEFKAPIEKDNSKDYRLLCLNHIKEFNKNWNYFAGMSDKEDGSFCYYLSLLELCILQFQNNYSNHKYFSYLYIVYNIK